MRWPENIENIFIEDKTYTEIFKFYQNVSKKYTNIYSRDEINKLIKNSFSPITQLKNSKLITDPLLDKWKGLGRIVIGKWNFAIDIKDNKIIVVDACHQQNMTNNKTMEELFEEDLHSITPRITEITFPPYRNNHYFIRCKIDGEQQFMKAIKPELFYKYKNDELTKYQLAEQCYAKELKEQRLNLDQILNMSRKL